MATKQGRGEHVFSQGGRASGRLEESGHPGGRVGGGGEAVESQEGGGRGGRRRTKEEQVCSSVQLRPVYYSEHNICREWERGSGGGVGDEGGIGTRTRLLRAPHEGRQTGKGAGDSRSWILKNSESV